ncbi:hypothetical protein E7T06_18405 [Deinococcus sp. Arct2-2]|uniref:hypothetical protein n=1 Tax=Deinococcus sp. Arct2-2 TaxID=2568653 RepID=UPI0010A337D6|nr:hypothetical protein [Deinococcus sp. Arct2-2]THF68012.1 hypothetical protein E7T06_18405 [Deinococcus sp. Arct2-2]
MTPLTPHRSAPTRKFLQTTVIGAGLLILTACNAFAPPTAQSQLNKCIRDACKVFQLVGNVGSPRIYLTPSDDLMRAYLATFQMTREQFAASAAGKAFVAQHTFIGSKVTGGTYQNLAGQSYTFTCADSTSTDRYRCVVGGKRAAFELPMMEVTDGTLMILDGILGD